MLSLQRVNSWLGNYDPASPETGITTEKNKRKKKKTKNATVRYHFTLTSTAVIIKKRIKQSTTSVKENVEKREYLFTVLGNINWYSHHEKENGGFFKK